MEMVERIERGKRLSGSGHYRPAIELFREVLAGDPHNESALFELGKAHYAVKEYADAELRFTRLLEINPFHAHALLLLGKTYRETGRGGRLRELLGRALEHEHTDPEIFREFGDSLLAEKEYAAARRLFERYLVKRPDDEDIVLKLAQLYNGAGQYLRARDVIRQAWERREPGDAGRRNRLLNELEIAENRTVLSSFPRILLATLTNRCNLQCPMCGRGDNPWDIREALRDEIISLLPYLELVTWQGGEVFLYPFFGDLLREANKHRGLRQIIITNGLLIDGQWAETLARGNVDLTVSVDSCREDVYRKLRRGGNLETLVRNIGTVNVMRQKCGSGMRLTLRCAVMESNYRELESFLEFAKEHRFDVLLLFPVSGETDGENIFASRNAEALAYLHALRPAMEEKARRYGIKLLNWLPDPHAGNDRSGGCGGARENGARPPEETAGGHAPGPLCFRPWKEIAVNVEGRIYPECLCLRPAGSVFEDSLLGVWNNAHLQAYRENLLKRDTRFCNEACVTGAIPPEHLKEISA